MEIDSILNPVKESQVVVVKPDKVDFKGKNITREKEGFFFAIRGPIFQENITILSVCNKTELQNTQSEMRQSCKEKQTNLQLRLKISITIFQLSREQAGHKSGHGALEQQY